MAKFVSTVLHRTPLPVSLQVFLGTLALSFVWASPLVSQQAVVEPAPTEAAAPPAAGREMETLPRVHVIATGGTIAGIDYADVKDKGSNDLLKAVPQLAEIARVTNEDPFTVPSSQVLPSYLIGLAGIIQKRLADDPELAGIVVTQGTDSLAECAFFMDLILKVDKPVIFTGAMRRPGTLAADGSNNLVNAVRLAGTPAMADLGVLVTMHDEIHSAREVEKADSSALDAFESSSGGALGFLGEERIFLLRKPTRRLSLPGVSTFEPAVYTVSAALGADGTLIKAAVDAGAKGIVLELFGRGNQPRAMLEGMKEATDKGIPVVVTTRTRRGPMAVNKKLQERNVLYAEDLDSFKARLVLMAALPLTTDTKTLQGYFDALSGVIH